MRCADRGVDLLRNVGHDAGHRLEVARQHHDGGDRRVRDDRRRPPIVLHDRDLAEEVSRAEVRQVFAVLRHGTGPGLEDEELVRQAPLLQQVIPGGNVDLVGPSWDLDRAPCARDRGTAGAFPSVWRPPEASSRGRHPATAGAPAATRHPGSHRALARLGDGGVPERTNGTASKAVRGLNRPSRVQITPPPPCGRASGPAPLRRSAPTMVGTCAPPVPSASSSERSSQRAWCCPHRLRSRASRRGATRSATR